MIRVTVQGPLVVEIENEHDQPQEEAKGAHTGLDTNDSNMTAEEFRKMMNHWMNQNAKRTSSHDMSSKGRAQ